MNRIYGIVFAVLLVLSSLTLSIFSVSYDASYFHEFQVQNDIPRSTGRSQEELDAISRDTIVYLQTGETHLMRHYSDRAQAHMVDVFGLFDLSRIIAFVSTAGAGFLLFSDLKKRREGMVKGALLGFGVLLVLFLGIVLFGAWQWNTLFTRFHEIFFANDLWLLDPRTDLMIQMMPTPFFVGMAMEIAIKTFFGVFAVSALWLIVRRRLERKKHV